MLDEPAKDTELTVTTTELTVVMPTKMTFPELLTNKTALDDVLAKLERESRAASKGLDVTVSKDRAEMRSIAMKVAKSKVLLDSEGLKLTEDSRKKIEAVNATRKTLTDRLDDLRDEIKAPAVKFDADEKTRVETIEASFSRFDLDGISPETPADEIQARITELEAMDLETGWDEFNHKAAGARAEALENLLANLTSSKKRTAEQEELLELRALKAERELEDRATAKLKEIEAQKALEDEEAEEAARIAAEAAETAREKAEKDAAEQTERFEREKAQAAETARIDAVNQAEKDRVEAANLAVRQAEEAAAKHAQEIAEAKAEADRKIQEAKDEQRAKDKAKSDEMDRELLAQKARNENAAHVASIKAEIAAALRAMSARPSAEQIADALVAGQIPHIQVTM
jgi:hypothetical protein